VETKSGNVSESLPLLLMSSNLLCKKKTERVEINPLCQLHRKSCCFYRAEAVLSQDVPLLL
jgi:hypothetical protein